MIPAKRLLLVFLSFSLLASPAFSQWTPVGPFGGAVNVVRVAGDRIYAAGDGGVLASDDHGATWQRLFAVPDMAITIVQIDPSDASTLYVAAAQHASYFGRLFTGTRLFKTEDSGLSWRELGDGLPAERSISSLSIDPSNPSKLYAGLQCGVQTFSRTPSASTQCDGCVKSAATGGAGIYVSLDGGETWSASQSGLTGEDFCVRGISADPLKANLVYAYSETVISSFVSKNLKSTDGGVTWTRADVPSPTREIVAQPNGQRFALSGGANCVFCSPTSSSLVTSEDGENWRVVVTTVPFNDAINGFAVDPQSNVYVARNSGLYVTSAVGATQTKLAESLTFRAARTVAVDPRDSGTLYLGTSAGLFISRDRGQSWSETALPQNAVTLTDLAFAPDGTMYAIFQDFDIPRELVRSRDGGRSWERIARLTTAGGGTWWGSGTPRLIVARDGVAYMLPGDVGGFKRFAGNEFSEIATPPNTFPAAIATDPNDAATLYVAGSSGNFLKSSDGGATWRVVVERTGGARVIAVAPTQPATIYYGVGEVLLRSRDAGETWTEVLHAGQVFSIAAAPARPATVYAIVCCNAGLMRTDDGGDTWRQVRFFDDARGIAIDPRDPNEVYLRYLGSGIRRSTDGGASFVRFNSGLTAPVVNDFGFNPLTGRLFATTFRGGVFMLAEPNRRHAVRR